MVLVLTVTCLFEECTPSLHLSVKNSNIDQ